MWGGGGGSCRGPGRLWNNTRCHFSTHLPLAGVGERVGGAEEQRTEAARLRLGGVEVGISGKAGHLLVWGFRFTLGVSVGSVAGFLAVTSTRVLASSSWSSET